MRIHPSKFWQAIAMVLMAVCQVQAAIVADSLTEFSGIQGQDNWLYGYYTGTLDPSSFAPMTVFGSSARPNTWLVDDDLFFTGIDSIGGHPNGSPSTRNDVVQHAVRRWIVESTGVFNISGVLSDLDTGFGDNGVVGRIFNGSTEIFSQLIGAGDMTGVNYSWTGNLVAGTAIDFVIDPHMDNDFFDSTRFTATIQSGFATVPEPTSLALLCSSCMLALCRGRRGR